MRRLIHRIIRVIIYRYLKKETAKSSSYTAGEDIEPGQMVVLRDDGMVYKSYKVYIPEDWQKRARKP